MSVKIGKSNFGGRTQRKYFKLKEGEQVYRILPPLGELADEGRWSIFHSVHYGYSTSDGRQKPFLSPEVKNKKGMVEVRDAAKERIQSLKAKLEESKKSGNKAVTDHLEKLVGQEGLYNIDNNHYMNVVDAQGNIGVLKLRHKAKLALDLEIKKLSAKGVDPTGVEDGRWFLFTRSGLGRDTTFTVNVLQENLNVAGVGAVTRDVTHSLNEDLLNRLGTETAELRKIFKKLTSEEVSKIVETSDLMTGVSKYMDELFSKNGGYSSQEEVSSSATTASRAVTSASSTVTSASDTAQSSVPSTPSANVNTTVVTDTSPVTVNTAKTTPSLTEMSNEEFLAAMNNGTI